MKFEIKKIITLTWEIEAKDKNEALAIVDDMGEHTGTSNMKVQAKKIKEN